MSFHQGLSRSFSSQKRLTEPGWPVGAPRQRFTDKKIRILGLVYIYIYTVYIYGLKITYRLGINTVINITGRVEVIHEEGVTYRGTLVIYRGTLVTFKGDLVYLQGDLDYL